MANIEIQGIEELFRKLGGAVAISTMRPPMQRSVYRLQAGMAKYPPQRLGSSYRRTGTLGRRWTTAISESADGLVGKIGNSTSYGPFVQSEMFQSRVHQGLWQTDADVAKQEQAAIVRDFDQTIQGALSG